MIELNQRGLIDSFVDELANFDDFGAETGVVEVASNAAAPPLRYFVNEFWTHAQRAGHALHEISYRACFKPQLPEFFIERLTGQTDVVYDPFMGRGTTPIQAALMGRRPVGNDANPMSIMMTRPRLNTPELADIESRLPATKSILLPPRRQNATSSFPCSSIPRRCARSFRCALG